MKAALGSLLICLLVLMAPRQVRADEGAAGQDLSRAELLFAAGKEAMLAKDFDRACRAFEDSLALDDSIGTRINLALCNEERGRIATAWGQFKDVEGRALKAGPTQESRARVAAEHASALAGRLSRIVLVPPTTKPEGLSVSIDGRPASELLWQMGIPVDRGAHTLVVSAPKKKAAELGVSVGRDGDTVSVTLPVLMNAPPPPPQAGNGPSPGVLLAEAERLSTRQTQRTLGIVTGASGLGIAAGGLVLGAFALGNVSDANACTTEKPCPLHAPTPLPEETAKLSRAREARSRVENFGLAASIMVPVGAVLTVLGAYLLYLGLRHDTPAKASRLWLHGFEF